MRVSVCEKVSVHMLLLLLELERDVECSHYFDCFLSFLGCSSFAACTQLSIQQLNCANYILPSSSLTVSDKTWIIGSSPVRAMRALVSVLSCLLCRMQQCNIKFIYFSKKKKIKFILNLNNHILLSSSSQVYLSFLIELITFHYSQG